MASITARVPQVDWSKGFDRHWNDGNPAVTHAFNALSFIFPQGEQFFIQVVREASQKLEHDKYPELVKDVKAFITQESAHTYQHQQYNSQLEQQGYKNVVHNYMRRLQMQAHKRLSPLTKLALVSGYEHYTAILGNYLLNNPQMIDRADVDMALIWGWHSAEETEHKAVCFDLYKAMGGGWLRRILAFLFATIDFNIIYARLYMNLLRHDGCLKPVRLFKTLRQYFSFFYGRKGIMWHMIGYGFLYLSPGFHPWNNNNRALLNAWLSKNRPRLKEVNN
ncbi:MAG: metal-dependent hydrolase [Gammaproteobacteria bacterium]|nr:metal-dependent hydrolase [Gammaproteobacteria bacterium]